MRTSPHVDQRRGVASHAPDWGGTLQSRAPVPLSIVVPMYNEAPNARELHARVVRAIEPLAIDFELIVVDDGSSDGTFDVLRNLQRVDPRVRVLQFSRNFGKESAMSAGLDAARGDFVAIIDADLQHPPECLPAMLARAREGFDVVYAVRRSRVGQSWFRRTASDTFHRFLRRVADVEIVDGAGDFRLMTRAVVTALRELRESQRYMKGLYAWAGFRATSYEFDQLSRAGAASRWSTWALVRLAFDALTSFSTFPLRCVTYAGVVAALTTVAIAIYYAVEVTVRPTAAKFPAVVVCVLLTGAVQLVSLGVLGEYVGRTYLESKRRPLYFVRSVLDAHGSADLDEDNRP